MGTAQRLDTLTAAARMHTRIERQLETIARGIGPQTPFTAPEPLANVIQRLWLYGQRNPAVASR
jgi:hypothetical protein